MVTHGGKIFTLRRLLSTLCAVSLFCSFLAAGQTPEEAAAPEQTEKPADASVSGAVVNQRDGRPLRRATVVLQPKSTGRPALSEVTDEKGRYSFPNVTPGAYELHVERDGFLASSTGWLQGYRFPPVFTLRPGANLTGLDFRLYPWGIIAGQITFENADPAVHADIALYRDVWRRGRHIYEIVGRAKTDDRGQYRLFNVPPGTYFLSAEWSRPVPVSGAVEQPRRDEDGRVLPDQTYAVTFYPSAQKLIDAAPIHLGYGEEAGYADVILGTARTVRIQGHVTSGVSGQFILSPGITLRRVGANDALAVGAAVTLNLDGRGGFELSGVTPGTYDLIAEADDGGRHLIGRRMISVGEQPISNLAILAAPPGTWAGKIRFQNGEPPDPDAVSKVSVVLEPRDDMASPVTALVGKEGDFDLELAPGETYDLYVKNVPEGVYLAAAHSGGKDLLASGATLEPGTAPEGMQLVLSPSGAEAMGVVLNDDRSVAPGVNIDLIPDPPAGRYRTFQSSNADEYGNFHLRGIAPGRYVLIAWAGEAPCDLYNPEALDACRAAGAQVTFAEGAQEVVTLKIAPNQK